MANRNFVDRTGHRYGRVVVLERAGSDGLSVLWRCRCDCGTEWIVPSRRLATGNTRSCGCMRVDSAKLVNRRHGMQATADYKRWENMKQRCFNPKNPRFGDYGGRGITVCDAWRDSFEAFFADVGVPPAPGMSLDRIDNNGNYEPGNVRWATRSEQQRNRTR